MKVAVVGTGISGLVTAWLLHRDHEIVVYDADSRIGGHTHTVSVDHGGRTYRVDTGFIVFNHPNYPNFTRLLQHLGVPWQPSDMSFSVRCERTGLEYCGSTLNTLFAQRRNLVRPGFHRMIRDILRFNRDGKEFLAAPDENTTIGEFLTARRYSRRLVDHYVVPMGAAIWSARPDRILRYPARFFLEFFANHRMLEVNDRPEWLAVRGGSASYLEALTSPFRDRIRTECPVRSVMRRSDGIEVCAEGCPADRFDRIVIATHSDQALTLLTDADEEERGILGAMPYQDNDVVLHTDSSLLPRKRLARASWNYHLPKEPSDRVSITYWMNRLQDLDAPVDFCVTLNRTEAIDPARILRRFRYHHPVFTPEAVDAQRRRDRIQGRRGTYYCGAYWGFGFHEDGVRSALAVGEHFGKGLEACIAASTRDEFAIGA